MSRTISLPNLDAADASPSGFELARLVAGELSADRRAELERLIASDPTLAARHAAAVELARAEQGQLALDVPLPRFLETHAAKTERPLTALLRRLRIPVGFSALAASAAAILFLVQPAETGPTYDGLKGGRIGFFVKADAAAAAGIAGQQLHAGDRIQFAVKDDTSKRTMVIVGIDGRGEVTTYAAEALDRERPKGAEPNKTRLLPASVVLDDSTGAERFFVVYADGDVEDVRARVEAAAAKLRGADLATTTVLPLGDLPLGEDIVQSSVHIVKVQ